MSQFIKRTNKYLIMAYVNNGKPQLNTSIQDDSFIDLDSNNISKITNMKTKNKFNFYNKFSVIGNTTIGSLVNKFRFVSDDYNKICQSFNEIKISETTDLRCYDCLKYIFSNDISLYEEINDFNKWIETVDIGTNICISFYELKYSGGTAGISFGHNADNKLPIIITERALEYIKSDKIIIKTGTLEKEMSGISSINFKLQPVNFVKGWLFIHKECFFEPKSLTVEYKAISADYVNPNGITSVIFKFVPISTDNFYKNKMMFETQNRFFDWAINSATKAESERDVMKSDLEIPMRLESLNVICNEVRSKEYSANHFINEIMNNLGFDDVIIVDKITKPDMDDVTLVFSNDDSHDPNKYTECLFKAYM